MVNGLTLPQTNAAGWKMDQFFEDVLHILNMGIFQPVMLVYWKGISPISRVIFHPSETNLFSAIYRGPVTRFMTIVGGPPCRERTKSTHP